MDMKSTRDNNLNFMRFVAAILVIICHSFPICYGKSSADALSNMTQELLNLGGVAVGFFFLIGGYLIAGSAERKQRAVPFFKARIKRLFPSLIVVIVLSTFVLGPMLSKVSLKEYFTSGTTYRYLINMILIPQHFLPGVFESNVYKGVVNGPLWTLPIEFVCYIGCFIMYKMGLFQKKKILFLIPVVVVLEIISSIALADRPSYVWIIRPIFLFFTGIVFYVYRESLILKHQYTVLFLLAFIGLCIVKQSTIAMLFCFPYICFDLAFGWKGKLTTWRKKHEISYGMYLWGWPVQQFLAMLGGYFLHWYVNAIVTVGIVSMIGLVNSIFIENNKRLKG